MRGKTEASQERMRGGSREAEVASCSHYYILKLIMIVYIHVNRDKMFVGGRPTLHFGTRGHLRNSVHVRITLTSRMVGSYEVTNS